MTKKIFYQDDANLDLFKNKTIGIIGYGSQGHAHALNLKDSGISVLVGLHSNSKSIKKAQGFSLKVDGMLRLCKTSKNR